MPYLVIDRAARPSLVVLDTDDEDEALSVGERYSADCADCVVINYSTGDVLPMSDAPRLRGGRILDFSSFATPEDALRAGFPPPSGDGGPSSGDEGDSNR